MTTATSIHRDMHLCPRCQYSTGNITSFRRHLQRKRKCIAIDNNVELDEIKKKYISTHCVQDKKCISCGICRKTFSSSQSFSNHKKRCEHTHTIDQLKNDNKILREKIEMYEKILHTSETSEKCIKFEKSIENSLNAFGKEKLDYVLMNTTLLNECIKHPINGISKLIRALHFNSSHKYNQNVMVTNCKLPYIKTYNGEEWVYSSTQNVVMNVVASCIDIMDMYLDDLHAMDRFDDNTIEEYEHFIKNYDDDDQKLLKAIKHEVYMTLRSLVCTKRSHSSKLN